MLLCFGPQGVLASACLWHSFDAYLKLEQSRAKSLDINWQKISAAIAGTHTCCFDSGVFCRNKAVENVGLFVRDEGFAGASIYFEKVLSFFFFF